MALFEVPKRAGRTQDNSILKKTKITRKSNSIIRGDSVAVRITEIKAAVEKNLGQHKDEYIILSTEKQLHEYIEIALREGVIAIDTETTGLDPLQDKVVGVCLFTPTQKPAYVPINHVSYVTELRKENQLTEEQVAAELKRLQQRGSLPVIDVVMHNAKFDIRFIRNQLGVNLVCNWDTMLAARILNENEESNGLKQLWKKYCNEGKGDAFNFDSLFNGISFDKVPINTGYIYAANDAKITYELYRFQQQYLRLDHERQDMADIAWVFHNIEMPCVNVVADMEDTGVGFDLDYAAKLSEKYAKKLQEVEKKFYRLCDDFGDKLDQYRAKKGVQNKLEFPINISSSSQIAIILYDVLNITPPEPKNPRGTGEAILLKIDHPIAKVILEYREVKKLMTTYIDKLPNCVNPKDGRIHCHFNQYGAATGRFSSSDPNLQNIPSRNHDIRKMFVATNDEFMLSSESVFEVYMWDEIETLDGFVCANNLKVGDVLLDTESGEPLSISDVCKEGSSVYITC